MMIDQVILVVSKMGKKQKMISFCLAQLILMNVSYFEMNQYITRDWKKRSAKKCFKLGLLTNECQNFFLLINLSGAKITL